ncbi:hypothetical protein [Streptomyces sp. NPDC015125]|uniref:hypothetical protein n=1 Tax=Streptomyces sp. NPDC015125 TaxID=3364938 RepID=UPI0036F6EDD6
MEMLPGSCSAYRSNGLVKGAVGDAEAEQDESAPCGPPPIAPPRDGLARTVGASRRGRGRLTHDADRAEAAGAIALFAEKYGERVRIVDIGDFSRELCGGTHVARCSQVGAFRPLTEWSIGSNLRRVEALTGHSTLTHLDTERRLLRELSTLLGTRSQDAPTALRKRLEALADAQTQFLPSSAGQLRGWMASPEAPAGRGHPGDFQPCPRDIPGTFRRVSREGPDSAESHERAGQGLFS